MDVTTMPSTLSPLLTQLKADFPAISFVESDDFLWSPSEKSIYYNPQDPQAVPLLLHELAHAVLEHTNYHRDIELIAIERAAWDEAKTNLAPTYDVIIDEDFAEGTLDTYRDWLHSRSTCPHCKATGLQTKQKEYTCLACQHKWRVNEARICALRRYLI